MAPSVGPLLDASQILPRIYDPTTNTIQVEIPSASPVPVNVLNDLIPKAYDSLSLTYYTVGNGAGQVQAVQYFTGGTGGTLVATLTLTYNAAGQVSTVVRT